MSSRSNQKSAGTILLVVAAAATAWGVYAWKYSRTPAVVTGSNESNRATEPLPVQETDDASPASGKSAELESAVQANLPTTEDQEAQEIEITPPASPADAASSATASPLAPASFGDSAARAMKTGRDALAGGELAKARAAMSRALSLGVSSGDQEFIRRELDRISDALLFSRAVSPGDPLTTHHVVKPGENLLTIAIKNRISKELIMTLNGLRDPDALFAGSKLKLIRGPFSGKVYKKDHRLDIYIGDVFIRSFPVGLGTDGGTPTGEWVIKSKLADPDWSDPVSGRYFPANDPENPIGERWISLECTSGDCMGRIGFGIHGTIDPKSIGADLSMGCIRLTPDDVAFVFDLFIPKHSTITVLP